MFSSTIKNSKILVVDNAPENVNLLSTILTKEGYTVRCIAQSYSALKIARSEWAELILLNSQMPEIDSYEFCQQLKSDEITKKIPLIFLGAFNELLNKIQAFQLEGIDYISKPLQAEEILIRVKNQLTISQAQAKINQLNQEWETKIQERTIELEIANQKLQQEIQSRQQAQDRLLKLALNDSITGLPNRKSFLAILKQALTKIKNKPDYQFAVLLVNCDNFQEIKCYLGHLGSNQLIVEIAHRLSNCLPYSMTLSRFEDNNFAIFLDQISDRQDAIFIAEEIQTNFQSSFAISASIPEVSIAQQDISISCRIGIVIAHHKYQTEYDILQDAEIALYQAAKSEQTIYQIVQTEISSQSYTHIIAEEFHKKQARKKFSLELKEAFRRKQFKIYYQPIVTLAKNQIIGVEAALRWLHPNRGLILPQDFLAVAEQSSLTITLSDFLLKYGINQLQSLHQDHESQKDFVLTIKLSAKQLLEPNLLDKVKKILKQNNLASKYLQFDIDEHLLIPNKAKVTQVLTELKMAGIKLTWADFEAKETSGNNLPYFLFENIKIAPSLIRQLEVSHHSEEAKLKIKEIVATAHKNNIKVMAADIKAQEQLEQLQSLGCDYGQGELFSKPLPRRSLEDFLVWRN